MPKTRQVVELRKMPTLDLIKLGEEKRAELFALKFQAVLGSLEQTHRIKLIKKEIARVELVLTEKKRAGENINQVVKADYSKAVDAADKAGKKVRKKQINEMKKAYGVEGHEGHDHNHESEIEKAMANSVDQVLSEAESIASEPKKTPAKKPVAKSTTKKVAEKTEKDSEQKAKPAEKKVATTKTTKPKTSGEAKPKTTATKTTKPSSKKEGAK